MPRYLFWESCWTLLRHTSTLRKKNTSASASAMTRKYLQTFCNPPTPSRIDWYSFVAIQWKRVNRPVVCTLPTTMEKVASFLPETHYHLCKISCWIRWKPTRVIFYKLGEIFLTYSPPPRIQKYSLSSLWHFGFSFRNSSRGGGGTSVLGRFKRERSQI